MKYAENKNSAHKVTLSNLGTKKNLRTSDNKNNKIKDKKEQNN